ncbi:hypothetical protein D3C78_1651240 [compost metagenome]
MFCDFLESTLCKSKVFNLFKRRKIKKDINRLRDYENPYLDDDIYDNLTDYVVEWYFHNREPILKPHNPKQYR